MVYKDENGEYKLKDQCTPEEEQKGELKTVFEDGELLIEHSLVEIRERINKNI
jgi:nicotinamide phosphoribosyltransferase